MTSSCEEQTDCCGLVGGAVTQRWFGWTSCRTVAAGSSSVGATAVPSALNSPSNYSDWKRAAGTAGKKMKQQEGGQGFNGSFFLFSFPASV